MDEKNESMVVLPSDEKAPGTARRMVGEAFARWGLDSDMARLVTSELVTNAHLHAKGTHMIVVRTWLRDDGHAVIEVWDSSEVLPEPGAADWAGESGRGLFMVEQMTRAWGARRLSDGTGKIVWAALQSTRQSATVDSAEGMTA
jgi:anti-sigma regulatory factor (Ser/Thr protein kinase)